MALLQSRIIFAKAINNERFIQVSEYSMGDGIAPVGFSLNDSVVINSRSCLVSTFWESPGKTHRRAAMCFGLPQTS